MPSMSRYDVADARSIANGKKHLFRRWIECLVTYLPKGRQSAARRWLRAEAPICLRKRTSWCPVEMILVMLLDLLFFSSLNDN